jgi:SAM-dependent methyltransferase
MLTWEEAVSRLRDDPSQGEFCRICYYDDPIAAAAERYRGSEEWAAIRQLLGGSWPARVLDVGAGRGIVSWAFAQSGARVTALEPDSSRIVGAGAIRQLSADTGVPIEIVSDPGERLPFESGRFDLVVCRASLHHARDLRAMCREIARVLRDGGTFLAIKEHVLDRPEDLPTFLANHPLHHLYGGENAYVLPEYRRSIEGAGLRIAKVFGPYENPLSYSPWLTFEQLREQLGNALARRVGGALARLLARSDTLVRWYGTLLSMRDRTPGRSMSFIARREGGAR